MVDYRPSVGNTSSVSSVPSINTSGTTGGVTTYEVINQQIGWVKELRVAIDQCIKDSEKKLTHVSHHSREMALVKTKLQEAKMWAGEGLKALGNLLPPEFRDEAK